jgi:REP element-mobilizing transposase RayT
LFLKVLEQARQRYGFVVVGYVVMPEHVHLLIGEPEKADPSCVVQAGGWPSLSRFAKAGVVDSFTECIDEQSMISLPTLSPAGGPR